MKCYLSSFVRSKLLFCSNATFFFCDLIFSFQLNLVDSKMPFEVDLSQLHLVLYLASFIFKLFYSFCSCLRQPLRLRNV